MTDIHSKQMWAKIYQAIKERYITSFGTLIFSIWAALVGGDHGGEHGYSFEFFELSRTG